MAFNLARKVHIRRSLVIALCTVICALLSFTLVKYIKNKVNAATPEGASVTLNYDAGFNYHGTSTHHFTIGSNSAFCANANVSAPPRTSEGGNYTADSFDASTNNYKAIKLIIYMYNAYDGKINDATAANYITQWMGDYNNDEKYGIVHSIVSYLYSGQLSSLDTNGRNRVTDVINGLNGLIGSDNDSSNEVWKRAKTYKLYRINGNGIDGVTYQNIIWIEPGPEYGRIKIVKHDSETDETTPQGNATFAGISFEVKKGNTVVYSCTLSGSNNSCTTDNLEVGSYTVTETSTNTSYPTVVDSQAAVSVTSGNTITVTFENTVKKGKVTIHKTDADTGSCTNTAGLSFVGVKIQITNTSDNPIYYGGTTYAKNKVIDTKTMTADQCEVTFNNLPYGSYSIKETVTSAGYVLNETAKNITIPTGNSYDIETTIENQPIRGDVKFVKIDDSTNQPMANAVFSISRIDNNNIKETHIVVTNGEGVVNTASSFIPHSQNTNGYDLIYDSVNQVIFSEYGTWFGLDSNGNAVPVKDSVGALPYGTYLIQELKCDANLFCTGIMDQKTTIKIETHNQVVDLGNWDNHCIDFSLGTVAVDNKDGDHYVEASEDSVIKDTIEYCVKPNMDFTIKGILMDKSTGEPLMIDGKTVESSINLNSTEECGTTEMLFNVDTSALGGKDIVVFESLYYKDSKVESHEDINDESQTITVVSLATVAEDGIDGDKDVLADEAAVIKDTIEYCVKAGKKYIIKGVLMNKETGEPVLVNGKAIEGRIEIEPEEDCGTVEMLFHFDATGLEGTDIVVFESLYNYNVDGEEGEDELIVSHEDLNDESQTISVYIPTPDTGHFTAKKGEGGSDSDIFIFFPAVAILTIGGYSIYRTSSRRRFFGKR